MTQVIVRNFDTTSAAFHALDLDVQIGIRPALIKVGEVVAAFSHNNANANIDNMPYSPRWSQFKVGTTLRGVYIAPRARRRRGPRRPNLAPLLLDQMEEALAENEENVYRALDQVIENAAHESGWMY